VFLLSQVFLIRFALVLILALSLGMGLEAPWGRIISVAYTSKTKGLLNVKENLRGCSPPGRNKGGGGRFRV